MNKLEMKEKRGYRFFVHPVRERMQLGVMAEMLLEQVKFNIERREAKGIDQTSTKIAVNHILFDEGGQV